MRDLAYRGVVAGWRWRGRWVVGFRKGATGVNKFAERPYTSIEVCGPLLNSFTRWVVEYLRDGGCTQGADEW